MKSLGLTALVVGAISFAIFGNPLAPIGFLLFMPFSRLAAPHWPWLLVAGGAIAGGASLAIGHLPGAKGYRLPVFAALWLVLSLGIVGFYAEHLRALKVAEFEPDIYIENSFFRSLRNAPAEFQYFAHAVAFKDCKLYAWSYREMAFYAVPESAGFDDPQYKWPCR